MRSKLAANPKTSNEKAKSCTTFAAPQSAFEVLLQQCWPYGRLTRSFSGMCSQNNPHRIGNVALPFQGSVSNKLDPPGQSAQVGQDPTVHEAHVWEGRVGWVEMCNFNAKRLQKTQAV